MDVLHFSELSGVFLELSEYFLELLGEPYCFCTQVRYEPAGSIRLIRGRTSSFYRVRREPCSRLLHAEFKQRRLNRESSRSRPRRVRSATPTQQGPSRIHRFASRHAHLRPFTLETWGVCATDSVSSVSRSGGRVRTPRNRVVPFERGGDRRVTLETWPTVSFSVIRYRTSKSGAFGRLRSKRGVRPSG